MQLKQPRNLELLAVGAQFRPEQVAAREPPTRLEKTKHKIPLHPWDGENRRGTAGL